MFKDFSNIVQCKFSLKIKNIDLKIQCFQISDFRHACSAALQENSAAFLGKSSHYPLIPLYLKLPSPVKTPASYDK